MKDLAIFAVSSDRSRWLAARSAALASNIANADSPAYAAKDVVSFEQAMSSAGTTVARTSAEHMSSGPYGRAEIETVPRAGGERKHSDNTVNLETELAALGDTRAQHAAVTGVVASFHRMLMSSVKG